METQPLPPTAPAPSPLPTASYFIVVAGLYTLLGSVAQGLSLPLGIWWSQLCLFILPTALLLHWRGFRPLRFLRLDRLPPRRELLAVVATSGAVFVSASALMAVCEELAPPAWVERFDISRLLSSVHGNWQILFFASVVVGAPLAEEVVFRGYLQAALRGPLGLGRAVLVQALLFSLVHLDPIGFVPRLILGLVFGCLVAVTGSLWSSIFAHALNNGISTYLYFTYGPGPSGEAAPSNPWQALALSIGAGLVVGALLIRLRGRTLELPVAPVDDPAALARRSRSERPLWELALLVTLTAAGFAGVARFAR